MSTATAPPLDRLVRKLGSRAHLEERDKVAILGLPHVSRTYPPAAYIVREGEPPKSHCAFIQSGLAFRQKITAHGARQIVALQLPGDLIDLQNLFLNISDHNVQALTEIKVSNIEREALRALAAAYPNISKALWVDALVESSIYREWVMNVGRRDARSRIAHVLCEFALRMHSAGMGDGNGFELPLTQEQLADTVGLTPVHVNRTLRALEADGVVQRDKRFIKFSDWDRVKSEAEFSALYLHLDQALPQ